MSPLDSPPKRTSARTNAIVRSRADVRVRLAAKRVSRPRSERRAQASGITGRLARKLDGSPIRSAEVRKRGKNETGATGAFLVAAELSRRGWPASVTHGTAPRTDVLAQVGDTLLPGGDPSQDQEREPKGLAACPRDQRHKPPGRERMGRPSRTASRCPSRFLCSTAEPVAGLRRRGTAREVVEHLGDPRSAGVSSLSRPMGTHGMGSRSRHALPG
jgi:hypothetical protein